MRQRVPKPLIATQHVPIRARRLFSSVLLARNSKKPSLSASAFNNQPQALLKPKEHRIQRLAAIRMTDIRGSTSTPGDTLPINKPAARFIKLKMNMYMSHCLRQNRLVHASPLSLLMARLHTTMIIESPQLIRNWHLLLTFTSYGIERTTKTAYTHQMPGMNRYGT
jgi:hypothetical protein